MVRHWNIVPTQWAKGCILTRLKFLRAGESCSVAAEPVYVVKNEETGMKQTLQVIEPYHRGVVELGLTGQ